MAAKSLTVVLAACIVAGEARRCGLPPERMLVALKRTWWALEEVRDLPFLDAQQLLSRLVSLSIRAYYEPPPVTARAAAAARP